MPSIGGITYYDLDNTLGNGVGHFDLDPKSLQETMTKVVRVAWTSVSAFINAIKFRAHPLFSTLYAYTFDLKAFAPPIGEDNWQWAIITIGYKNLSYDPTTNKEVKYSASAQRVTVAKEGLKRETGGTTVADNALPDDPELLQTSIDCTIIYHNRATFFPNKSSCEALISQVNVSTFTPDSDTSWGAGQVLYVGYDEDIKYMGGAKTYEISHKFIYSFIDWRKSYLPQLGDFAKVVNKVTGNPKYLAGNFGIFT